ncbi:MAG: FG-GAP-like repeat-containing protein [Chthoniobacteraceae bacterium]
MNVPLHSKQAVGPARVLAVLLSLLPVTCGAWEPPFSIYDFPNGGWETDFFWKPELVPTALHEVMIGTPGILNNTTSTEVGITFEDAFSYRASIGGIFGYTGTVKVDNTRTWSIGEVLNVGLYGKGTLNIIGVAPLSTGAVVSNDITYIGRYSGSDGTANVGGWLTNGGHDLNVGYEGTGMLFIYNGGVANNSNGYIGNKSGSTGVAAVNGVDLHGVGSRWTNSGALHVGYYGNGTLNIQAGGTVSNTSGYVGENIGSTGAATVTGVGSQWTNSGDLSVGYSGNGTLNVQAGGKVSNTSGYVGYDSTGTGSVTVTDAGSQWTSKILFVGNGMLAIRNGGKVSTEWGKVGTMSATPGLVNVTGPGSEWKGLTDFSVGSTGTGMMTVQDGGKVISDGGRIGESAVGGTDIGTGTVTVTGVGSEWASDSADIRLGYSSGVATLNIQDGGKVSDPIGYIGGYKSTGTATVTGAGSQWTNSSNLYVGAGGEGTLTVDAGGKVTTPNTNLARITYSGGPYPTRGALNLNGAPGSRGILETTHVTGDSTAASSLTFNGGILRAANNLWVDGFLDGRVQLQSGGAFLDTQGFYGTIRTSLQGTGGLTKQGSGQLELQGDSTYTGGTVVEAGSLYLNGSVKGPLTVNSAGALLGKGVISGNAVFNGKVTPGNSYQGLHFDNCTWNGSTDGSATMLITLRDTVADELMIGQAFNKGGANTYRFDFQGTGPWPLASKTYRLATFRSTTFSASDFSYTNLDSGYIGVFAIVGGELQFQVTQAGGATYTISTSALPVASGGTSGGGTVNSGSSVTVVATPNGGYSFVNWTEGGSPVSTSASYNFTASASHTLVANFAQNTYTISISAGANGSISPNTPQMVFSGTGAAFTATPVKGYRVDQWLVNGTVAQTGGNGFTVNNVAANTTVAVTFKVGVPRDFNSDGNADVVFQNSAGQIYSWFLDGTGNGVDFSNGSGIRPGSGYRYSGGLGDWRIVGIADMNSDGNADLVFQNAAGQIYVWFLDGSGNGVDFSTGSGLKPGSRFLYGGGMGDWRVVACADVNGDGCTDLVFQNNAGQIYVWFLDGTGNGVDFPTGSGLKPGSRFLFGGGMGDWRAVACADLNGDGFADLIFQNAAGQIYVWFLDGTGNGVDFSSGSGLKPGSRYLYGAGLGDWRVAACTDVNGDGFPDLTFQNAAGQIYVWFLDGTGNGVDFPTGSGLKPGSRYLYGSGLGDWRLR